MRVAQLSCSLDLGLGVYTLQRDSQESFLKNSMKIPKNNRHKDLREGPIFVRSSP
jgi:hypothetical protein